MIKEDPFYQNKKIQMERLKNEYNEALERIIKQINQTEEALILPQLNYTEVEEYYKSYKTNEAIKAFYDKLWNDKKREINQLFSGFKSQYSNHEGDTINKLIYVEYNESKIGGTRFESAGIKNVTNPEKLEAVVMVIMDHYLDDIRSVGKEYGFKDVDLVCTREMIYRNNNFSRNIYSDTQYGIVDQSFIDKVKQEHRNDIELFKKYNDWLLDKKSYKGVYLFDPSCTKFHVTTAYVEHVDTCFNPRTCIARAITINTKPLKQMVEL